MTVTILLCAIGFLIVLMAFVPDPKDDNDDYDTRSEP